MQNCMLEPTHVMYLNVDEGTLKKSIGILEPTHVMYLNKDS